MKNSIYIKIICTGICLILLSGCAGMVAEATLSKIKYSAHIKNKSSVKVDIKEFTEMRVGFVTMDKEEFQGKVEKAIKETKLFSTVVKDNERSDYILEVRMNSYTGSANKSSLDLSWRLIQSEDNQVFLNRNIESEYISTAIGNVFAINESMGGAVRKNISTIVSDIGWYDISIKYLIPYPERPDSKRGKTIGVITSVKNYFSRPQMNLGLVLAEAILDESLISNNMRYKLVLDNKIRDHLQDAFFDEYPLYSFAYLKKIYPSSVVMNDGDIDIESTIKEMNLDYVVIVSGKKILTHYLGDQRNSKDRYLPSLEVSIVMVDAKTKEVLWKDNKSVNGSQFYEFEIDEKYLPDTFKSLTKRVVGNLLVSYGVRVRERSEVVKLEDKKIIGKLLKEERYKDVLEIYPKHYRAIRNQLIGYLKNNDYIRVAKDYETFISDNNTSRYSLYPYIVLSLDKDNKILEASKLLHELKGHLLHSVSLFANTKLARGYARTYNKVLLAIEELSSSISNKDLRNQLEALIPLLKEKRLTLAKTIPLIKVGLENIEKANAQSEYNKTALHMSAELGISELVEYFLEKGLDINYQVNEQETPLMSAATGAGALFSGSMGGNVGLVKYLINKGADVNAKRKDGATALMLAAQYGNLNVVKELLKNGANINDVSKLGTAKDHAKWGRHDDIADYLAKLN